MFIFKQMLSRVICQYCNDAKVRTVELVLFWKYLYSDIHVNIGVLFSSLEFEYFFYDILEDSLGDEGYSDVEVKGIVGGRKQMLTIHTWNS